VIVCYLDFTLRFVNTLIFHHADLERNYYPLFAVSGAPVVGMANVVFTANVYSDCSCRG
jgi:hypothetical protein